MDSLRHDDLNSLIEEALTTEYPERLQYLLEIGEQDKEGKAILRAIMTNPNTPPEMLFKLGADFPQELLEHPIFNLLLLENPLDLVKRMPYETQISLLGLDNLPIPILRIIIQNLSQYVLFEETYNLQISVGTLEILAHDTEIDVRQFVGGNSNTPASILEILAHDTEVDVRSRVADNPNTPINLLEILAHDTEIDVRYRAEYNFNF